ncbi:MAG: nickel-dependent lactate racemase [Clostridiales bacterium]|nr:nickel-dependent lactate racemase [Clostridiales bacterium]
MKNVELKYGESTVSVDLSGAESVEFLLENEMPVIEDIGQELIRGLEDGAIDSPPLRELVSPDDRITIIISDLTRFWMRQDMICELLVKYLEGLGVKDEDIAVLVALGTHRMQTEAELEKLASSYVYSRCSVVNHNCDAPDLVSLGVTSYGTEVKVNPLAVGRKVIVISGTVHHLMAGYGGGRKSILPGIAGRETIRENHRRALDPLAPQTDGKVGSGKLRINPINRDMDEAAAMVAPIFGISIVVNNNSRHSGIFCGSFDSAWLASCRFCQECYGVPIDYEADIVLASCNGYPKDINLYQGVKALLNGVRAMKPGGTFVFFAECREGGGAPDFFNWIEPLNRGELDSALRSAFTIAGYIFYASCESIAKAGDFYMLSAIPAETVKGMGIKAYADIDEMMKNIDFTGKKVYVIPNGGSLLPQLKSDYEYLNNEVI